MTFTKVNNMWEGTATSTGKTLYELERAGRGVIGVQVKLSGASKWADYGGDTFGANAAFVVDAPSGVSVKIISGTEVTAAYSKADE